MPLRVELSARAERDLRQIFHFINAAESQAAARWFNGLEHLIMSLAKLPERGKVTEYDPGLRYLLFGKKPHVYRILYRVDMAMQTVAVRHIRHGARKPLERLR